jgi:hypothetical protein
MKRWRLALVLLGQPCQHFTCDSTSELNMMYHAWTFPHITFTADARYNALVHMGIFEAHGIVPTHQTLEETVAGMTDHVFRCHCYTISTFIVIGIRFNGLSARQVGIHSQRFSPW